MSGLKIDKLHKIILFIVQNKKRNLTRTKLVKMLYLLDKGYRAKCGEVLTGLTYKRYFYGPYSEDIVKALSELNGFEITETTYEISPGNVFYDYSLGSVFRFSRDNLLSLTDTGVDREKEKFILSLIELYDSLSTKEVLSKVYSAPEFQRTSFGEPIVFDEKN